MKNRGPFGGGFRSICRCGLIPALDSQIWTKVDDKQVDPDAVEAYFSYLLHPLV